MYRLRILDKFSPDVIWENTYEKKPINVRLAHGMARKLLAQWMNPGDRIELQGNCAVQHFYIVTPTGDLDIYAELYELV